MYTVTERYGKSSYFVAGRAPRYGDVKRDLRKKHGDEYCCRYYSIVKRVRFASATIKSDKSVAAESTDSGRRTEIKRAHLRTRIPRYRTRTRDVSRPSAVGRVYCNTTPRTYIKNIYRISSCARVGREARAFRVRLASTERTARQKSRRTHIRRRRQIVYIIHTRHSYDTGVENVSQRFNRIRRALIFISIERRTRYVYEGRPESKVT